MGAEFACVSEQMLASSPMLGPATSEPLNLITSDREWSQPPHNDLIDINLTLEVQKLQQQQKKSQANRKKYIKHEIIK